MLIGVIGRRARLSTPSYNLTRSLSSLASSKIFHSPYKPIETPKESLFPFLREKGNWSEVADKVAVRCSTNSFAPITYKELDGRIIAAAHKLRSMGFKQGDVLNIHLHNCQQYIVSFLATAALGGTATTSNPVYVAKELATQQINSGAKFVVSSKSYEATVTKAAKESGLSDSVYWVEDDGCFANALPDPNLPMIEPDRPIDIHEDLVTLPYSSGTTGVPKGVMLTHSNMTSNILQTDGCSQVVKDDVLIGVLPLYHIYGMTVLMCYALARQSELVLLSKFEPPTFLDAMSKFKVTVGFLVPPIILFLAKHPIVKEYNLSSLKWIMSGAAPLDAATQKGLSEELNVPISQGWGMTELAPIGCVGDHFTPVWGSAGVLAPSTEGAVIDPSTGEGLPPMKEGELLIRGPQVMKGYLNRPEATAETIRDDGFLRTGDLAYYDESGNIFLVDRLKELIKVKGFQVAPAEVEGRLLELPQVADAAVIGVNDERSGQVPKAFVVLKEGESLTSAQAVDALRETLSEFKLPGEVVFVEAIPKSPSGKILRRMLS